jgi:hypothetical protein
MLHRAAEAKQRIDAAFDLLRDMKAWPARSLRPGEEPVYALRALADYDVGSGRLADAIETYQELLDKLLASGPSPDLHLRHRGGTFGASQKSRSHRSRGGARSQPPGTVAALERSPSP